MAGEDRLDELVAYLSRLTGETLSADAPTLIRSVHRAALSAWARKQNLPISFGPLGSSGPIRPRDLLTAGAAVAADPVRAAAAPAAPGGGAIRGVGIDIEEVDALPQADDYREHAFYRDNFTDAEMAHCIRQADVKASFCGLWAAKEAIVKAGLADAPSGRCKGIEIGRDAFGRPGFPGAQLSISHTTRTAVAVCIAVAGAQAPAQMAPAPFKPAHGPARAEAAAPARRSARLALAAGAAAGFVLIAVDGAVSLALRLWP